MGSKHISNRESFLMPETRDGVAVSASLKAMWKVMLDMLECIIAICNKYNLTYYMDGGSLLGAIRHKGFIPWDDDMDISLPRDDFRRFLEVAPKELPGKYFVQYTTTDPCHIQGFACLRDSATAAIDPYWAPKKIIFNMGIGIDIFPLDNVPDSVIKFKLQLLINRLIRPLVSAKCETEYRGIRSVLVAIAKIFWKLFGFKRIVGWRDANFARYNNIPCKRISSLAYNQGLAKAIWPTDAFKEKLLVPFEYLDVVIPAGYETYLNTLYGKNWRTPVRGAGDHDELYFDTERSYREVLVEKFGYKPEWFSEGCK